MGLPGGFLLTGRYDHAVRSPVERVGDFDEFVVDLSREERAAQAGRCMNCGVPFCLSGLAFNGARQATGCPLHNLIPEVNDLLFRGRVDDAAQRLSLRDPFPEFTSRVCPAPCEVACNLGRSDDPVTIHDNERTVADYLWEHGDAVPLPAVWTDAPLVSVVGSGPAGLAAAWELARRGMRVRVYERDDRPGGLLMYGIPNMKLPKDVVERRTRLMREAGVEFRCGVDAAGIAEKIVRESAAVVLAVGSRVPRGVDVPGADLSGVHFALDYLTDATRALLEGRTPQIDAAGKDVVVIGGGDTGVDCVATALRQGAASVKQVVRAHRPPDAPHGAGSWPSPRGVYTVGYGQQEAAELLGEDPRIWSCDTRAFVGDEGAVCAVRICEGGADGGAERDIPAHLVLIAKGFVGPEAGVLEAFGVKPGDLVEKGGSPAVVAASGSGCPVYVAGDARLGPSIVASAMADGMRAAELIVRDMRSVPGGQGN